MSERPKGAADPDATVMLPGGGLANRGLDDDATVMLPADRSDDDATVMIPAARIDDADATVMVPTAHADEDATVMIPPARGDDDATVMMPAVAMDEPDPEATIAIPTPGRRREAHAPELPAAASVPAVIEAAELGGLNPLVAAGNPVLGIAAHIRHALKHPDPLGLRADLNRCMDAFETSARGAGIREDVISAASAALCALVDESVASTPWGASWKSSGLLEARHGEHAGGEAFFDVIEKHSADSASNRELLEFFYICLALGFEGRYREVPDGRRTLTDLRKQLLDRIRTQRPGNDGELSAHWRGVAIPARRPVGALGLWLAGSVAALALAVLYLAYSASLGSMSDPVARELAQLKAVPAPERPQAVAGAKPTPEIAKHLSAEIERGEIAVADAPGSSTVVIRSDRLFASGSARLESGIEAVVLRVAEALDRVPGTIVVTGHTDDIPIRTVRFPSNWELSNERAASVVRLMGGKLKDPGRLRAEGMADSVPAAPNDSSANRARNRRVEVVLKAAP